MSRIKIDKDANYFATIDDKGYTRRMKFDASKPFQSPRYPEIEDVAINNVCKANCFPSSTWIGTDGEDFSYISDFKQGDTVSSVLISDDKMSATLIKSNVLETMRTWYEGDLVYFYLPNGYKVMCTPNHKFLKYENNDINGKLVWEEAENLHCEDFLYSVNSAWDGVMEVHGTGIVKDFKDYVFNLSCDNHHNYVIQNSIVASNCSYCYISAMSNGKNFENICEKAESCWGKLKVEERPLQIAIGGAGEPTLHPDFAKFLKTVKSLEIIPNYTTNGMHLSQEVLEATKDYCGGVALSWHPHLGMKHFETALRKLREYTKHLSVHIIIGQKGSYEDLQYITEHFGNIIDNILLLPYQKAGRASEDVSNDAFKPFLDFIKAQDNQEQFAVGALMYDYLLELKEKNELEIPIDIYEPEMFSGYRVMDETFDRIRHSSYNRNFKN